MIRVQDIHKSFPGNHVLRGISADFEKGKTNLIIGQSGSGKTVFLKSLLGLHSIDSGEIFYDDRRLSEMDREQKRILRRELGMVFQGSALFDSLTVEENVGFPLKMFSKLTTGEIRKRIDFCLDRVNISKSNNLYPAEISGGMQKRVAIARAIVMEPKYLFCDEPNSGLDPQTATVIDDLIRELTQEFQITTIVNTHDMNSVMQIGDHIVYLREGKKVWEGNRDEIVHTDNEYVSQFVFSSDLFKMIRKGKRDNS